MASKKNKQTFNAFSESFEDTKLLAEIVSKYKYEIFWSEMDNCWIGKVLEFNVLKSYSPRGPIQALTQIMILVDNCVRKAFDDGGIIPTPTEIAWGEYEKAKKMGAIKYQKSRLLNKK